MNVADAWEAIADQIPEAPATIAGATVRSWRSFEDRASRFAGVLAAHGVGPDAKVGLFVRNGHQYLEAQFGCFKRRATACNVNYRYVAEELRYLLDNADAEALVYDADLVDRVDAARHELPGIRLFVQIGGDAPEWAVGYEAAIVAADPEPRIERSGDDQWFLYTGGTTGLPKAVIWEHDTLVRTAEQHFRGLKLPVPATPQQAADHVARIHEWGKVTRQLVGPPLIHGTSGFAAIATLLQGGAVAMLPPGAFDADELWRMVEHHSITYLVIVGDAFARPMLAALDAAARRGQPYDLTSVRVIMSSGVMWSAEVKAGMLAHRPELVLIDTLGSSEGVGIGTSITRPGSKPTTARFALGENATVIDDEGNPVTPGSGVAGRLAVAGALPLGYYKDPEKTAATYPVVDGRRYAVAGDYATVETDGTIRLLGRGSVCINTGGEKVYPEEVEEALKQHPAVVDCNVVGLPDERFGQVVTAVFSRKDDVSDDDLRAHLRARLSGYKVPRLFVPVDEIARGPNGKADYRWAEQAAESGLDG